jgi:hypothetical protein
MKFSERVLSFVCFLQEDMSKVSPYGIEGRLMIQYYFFTSWHNPRRLADASLLANRRLTAWA